MTQPARIRSHALAAGLALLASMVLPGYAAAQDNTSAVCEEQPIIFGQTPAVSEPVVLQAPVRPLWRVVPPSSDPDAGDRAMPAFATVRGLALCGADDLLLARSDGEKPVLVRLPGGVSVASVPPGTEFEAVGLARPEGGLDAVQLTILPEEPAF